MNQILEYFPDLSSKQIEQLEALLPLYKEWNDKINVVSRKDIEELYERHVLHSLAIANFIRFVPGTQVLDIGTGGGFPGIPLAIVFPKVDFLLADSIEKKIKVVRGVAESLGLTNVEAQRIRVEEIKRKFDFIVCRAVAKTEKIMGWTKKHYKKQQINIIPNGLLALKGGDLTEEMKSIRKETEIIELKDFFIEDFFETKKLVYVGMGN